MAYGWFTVSRQLTEPDHDLHPMSTGDPACRMGAWVDLLGNARWRAGSGLERGQLRWSVRFMSGRWNWSTGKVSRFLSDLEEEGRIRRERTSNTRPAVITICNYDDYQDQFYADGGGGMNSNGARNEQQRGPSVNSNGHKEGQVQKQKQTTTAAAVGDFCERTGATWRLDKGIDEWVAEIKAEPKYAGADHAYEIRKCADWHVGKNKTPSAPDMSIRNWLERAAKDAQKENGGRHWSEDL